jgi:predicted N-formylglutamate amidohydrolase
VSPQISKHGTDDRHVLVLTCEHADRRVPRRYAGLFAGARSALESHEGWDPGAWQLARLLARRLERPLFASRWSRLLVEANRSPSNPRIWSRFTRELPRAERQRILERYWRPHREEVGAEVAEAIDRGERVVHVAVHSFTPVLDGEVRHADVAFLFDSARAREAEVARRWRDRLRERAPELRVRCNYPYRGRDDGLASWLRRRHPAARYLGLEVEVNQALAAGPGWRRVGEALAASLAAALALERPRRTRIATRESRSTA